MTSLLRLGGQLVFWTLAIVLIGYFSNQPVYHRFPVDRAQIKLAFTHGADRKDPCRRLSSVEIAKLPAHERKPMQCGRERLPIHLQMELDGEMLIDQKLAPTGFSSDGPARAYETFIVEPGRHAVVLRLKDSDRSHGFDFVTETEISLSPRQNLAIDFKADTGGFRLN